MKVLAFFLSVLVAVPVNDRTIVQKSCQTSCSGKADNFEQFYSYALRLQGMQKLTSSFKSLNSVDLTQCNLRTVENVFTWMSCTNMCFMVSGVQDIYNPGPNGFVIFPHKTKEETFTVDDAKIYNMVVHYQVTGEC